MAFNKEKVMDAARKFVDKGQIDKAVKEYLRIVHEDPKDVRVWLKIGDLYAKKGSKQDAIETYLKVARFYHDQGFFLKAVAVYKQILKLDPRLVDVILKLAELYRQLGLMSDAMQHFESVAAHFHREGNTKEALATVKKLVDLDPENIATRIKLAELYSKENLVDDAGTEFQVACEQLRRLGRQDDFIKVAERLLWHKPDNHALNRELSGLYLRRNDPRRALQKLQACFKADPRDVETLALLAQAFQGLDQKAKTVSVLKELARVHVENKQRDKAGDVFRKILEFVSNDPDALGFLGLQPPAATPAPQRAPAVAIAPLASRAPSPVLAGRPPSPLAEVAPATVSPRTVTGDGKFQIANDLPALPSTRSRMTGSMPLVDEQSLSGVDFALPEYDDSDFSADMEPAPDPRAMSAAGERHAEEIAKILAETDVYVKYGLHQKAVDHLRRVFALDPDNVEAHERLKDIFVSQGRENEAELELLKLAELVAGSDPDRAEAYLQELLAINGTHTGAFELARRFRLRVARLSSSSGIEYAPAGGVASVDLEMDDLHLAEPAIAPRAVGIARTVRRDSIDDFDPEELIGDRVAHGSPTPQRPPSGPSFVPSGSSFETDNFELEFEPSAHSTRKISPEHAALLASADGLDDRVIVDRPRWGDRATSRGDAFRAQSIDAQLDDALDDNIDQEIAAELGHTANGLDMPFDPDEARAFDAGVPKLQADISGFEETDMPHLTEPGGGAYGSEPGEPLVRDSPGSQVPLGYDGSDADTYDPYGSGVATPQFDPTASHAAAPEADQPGDTGRAGAIEDDLDEADFYVGQAMYAEALDVLRKLQDRYPNHRLINVKYQEVAALARGEPLEPARDPIEHEGSTLGTDAIVDLDALEEVSPDEFEEVSPEPSHPARKRSKPTVLLERPIDEGDAETHYDLGLAYKEMGLHDEAIKAFEKTLRSPEREVQCRVMIGMCHREMGNPSEAIHQFKQGLHAEPKERERQSLHYEIGMTYESIGDDAEALYYFEMVIKRDPGFADAAAHADSLRGRVGRARSHDDDI